MTRPSRAAAPTAPPASPEVVAATRATYAAFTLSGVAFASWASRIPQVRDALSLSPARLGLVLLGIAGGSVVSLPLAGRLIHAYGSRRTVSYASAILAVGLCVVAVGYLIGLPPLVVGLVLLGFANGAWDVAMNVQGAAVERHLGRSIMPRFHAGYSIGTVAGALLGALAVALHVPVTAHLVVVAALVAVAVPLSVRAFVPDVEEEHVEASRAPAASAWTEPKTLLVGLFVLAFAFAEGTGNDWVSVALIDGYAAPAVLGTLAFAAFLSGMTLVRWYGPRLLDTYGRVPVVRGLAGLGVAGVALFVLAPTTPLAFVGVVLWGGGVSLGFPVGMSAGADDPARAAARVSVIASIGYCAFLGGPPLVGFLGNRFTVLEALFAVAALLAVATAAAGSVAEPAATPTTGATAGPTAGATAGPDVVTAP